MYSVQLWACWRGTKTTGINRIIYPEGPSFRKTVLLEGCFPSDCLFCKIFTFFFLNVLFTLQQPMEMKANYPWKEVHKLFTGLCNRAPGISAERLEVTCLPRRRWEQSWTHWARPQQSLLGSSDRKSHVVSFSAAERDRCTQINITVQYQRRIVISPGIFKGGKQHNFYSIETSRGLQGLSPSPGQRGE